MTLDDPALPPPAVGDAGELVAAMRALKERTGLSLRQLEERAEARGEVLARSTLADVLRRASLPRPDTLAAFVRACGGGEDAVRAWLAARDRIAAGAPPVPDAPGLASASAPGGRRRPGRGLLAVAAGLVLLLAAGAWVLWPDDEGEVRGADAAALFGDDPVRISPAGAPDLCVSEGRDSAGAYDAAIAVQEPCAQAVPPSTSLRAAGDDGWYHVVWDHPDEGTGCLALVTEGTAEGYLEPVDWDRCAPGSPEQRFRLEPVPGEDAYLLRNARSDACLAAADTAEIVQGPCEGDSAQSFTVTPAP
jgi:transcriptional regulator with XRE-family HTH domain